MNQEKMNKISKILAEFEGWTDIRPIPKPTPSYMYNHKLHGIHPRTGWRIPIPDYFSLDRLVLIWKKLKIIDDLTDFRMWSHIDGFGFDIDCVFQGKDSLFSSDGKSIQEAAAIATVKIIEKFYGKTKKIQDT